MHIWQDGGMFSVHAARYQVESTVGSQTGPGVRCAKQGECGIEEHLQAENLHEHSRGPYHCALSIQDLSLHQGFNNKVSFPLIEARGFGQGKQP